MSKNATADDSEQSFEPPYPANSRGYAKIDDLEPFHLEDETYIKRDNADLVASIEEHGFREGERPTITPDGTILLGHRRVDAADQLGMERVPVFVEDVEPDSHEARSIFVSSNQHRDKTPGERVNEALILEEVEKERAKQRQSEGGRAGGEKGTQNFADPSTGEAREKAAQQVGFSRESYRKGKYVKEKAQDDDVAAAEWEDLMQGDQSIHGAYTVVKDLEEPDESEGDDGDADDPDDDTGSEETTDEKLETLQAGDATTKVVANESTDSSGQQDSSSGGDTTEDTSDGEDEEPAYHAPGPVEGDADEAAGDDNEPPTDIEELEAEKERAEEKAEIYLGNLQNLSRENIANLKGPSLADAHDRIGELEEKIDERQEVIGELNGTVADLRSTLKDLVHAIEYGQDDEMTEALDNAGDLI